MSYDKISLAMFTSNNLVTSWFDSVCFVVKICVTFRQNINLNLYSRLWTTMFEVDIRIHTVDVSHEANEVTC